MPALPVRQSTAIVIGDVLDGQAYVSDDQTGVYSEFTVRISEVLKSNAVDLTVGCLTEVEREGGQVKFPSGRIHWYSIDKENMPKIARRYIFFLTRENPDEAFHVLTSYELRGAKVFALDELPQFQVHNGKSEADFLNVLNRVIANPS